MSRTFVMLPNSTKSTSHQIMVSITPVVTQWFDKKRGVALVRIQDSLPLSQVAHMLGSI